GTVNFATGSSFFVDLTSTVGAQPVPGTQFDQLKLTGTITFNGTVTLAGTSGSIPIGSKFTIVDNDTNVDPVTGLLSNTPAGGFVPVGGNIFNITYRGDDGNNVALPLPGRFDFGTTTSPVDTAEGYGQVTNTTLKPTLGVGPAFGWQSNTVLAVDRGVVPGVS